MILVILGHVAFPQNFRILIYAFHMPLFFFLSGITLNTEIEFKIFLKKRVKGLLIPLISFSVFQIVVCEWLYGCVIAKNQSVAFVKDRIIGILVQGDGENIAYASELWFLSCLFIAEILYYFIHRLLMAWRVIIILLGAVGSVIWNATLQNTFPLIWFLNVVFIVMVFIFLGELYRKYISGWKNITSLRMSGIYFGLMVITALLNAYKCNDINTVNLSLGVLGNPLLYFMSAFLGILFMVAVFKNINKKMKLLQYIGRNSLIYYGTHMVAKIIPDYIAYHMLGNWQENQIAIFFVGLFYLALMLPIIYGFSEFINKKIPFVLGKVKL